MRRHEAIGALRAVAEEHLGAAAALALAMRLAARDPVIVRDLDVELAWLRACQANLERTYAVRVFVAFEEHLRGFWATLRKTYPRTRDLIDGCAARQRVDGSVNQNAHAVREYRNSIVHGESSANVRAIGLGEAVTILCRFVAWMPPEW